MAFGDEEEKSHLSLLRVQRALLFERLFKHEKGFLLIALGKKLSFFLLRRSIVSQF